MAGSGDQSTGVSAERRGHRGAGAMFAAWSSDSPDGDRPPSVNSRTAHRGADCALSETSREGG